ncbi:protein rolling stone-like [Chironomus tepperi]|uniref:protein rolling stone-like n=1 Tax=Chironomus tepperi TaxID=113505 RepID=UPI00391F1577
MSKSLCQKIKFNFESEFPSKFLSSQWQQDEKSSFYMIYRVIIAMFYNFSFLESIIYSYLNDNVILSLIYLTRMNLFVTTVTCNIGAYYVIQYYRGEFKSLDCMTSGLKFYWFLYISILPFACVVSGIYWTMLFNISDDVLNLNNVLVHITNSLVLFFDLFIIQHEYRIAHMIYPMITGILYLSFTFIYPLLGGIDRYGHNYVYPILNWKEDPSSAFIIGASAVVFLGICHLSFCGIAYVKALVYNSCTLKCQTYVCKGNV